MNVLLANMIKTGICLLAFYLIYISLLSKDTLYLRNRAFILVSALLSLVLPFIVIEIKNPIDINFGKMLSEVMVYGSRGTNGFTGRIEKIDNLEILNFVYLAGLVFFGLKFLIDMLELIYLIVKNRKSGTRIIRFRGHDTSGFSALGHIFINSGLSPDEEKEIIRHEQNHLDNNHFLDIVFIEIIKVFQWFNPAVYMLNRSLRAIHEYQADEECIRKGIAVMNYQRLLMNQVFNSKIFGLTNCFSNPRLIKKRMIMMTRPRSTTFANIKLLPAVPVIALALAAFSSSPEILQSGIMHNETGQTPGIMADSSYIPVAKTVKGMSRPQVLPPPPEKTPDRRMVQKFRSTAVSRETEPFVVVEEMPQFPGGPESLLRFIAENVVYPSEAKEQNLQGKVIVRFAVTAEGKVAMASVLKGVSSQLDNEALRVVRDLPDFRPGRQGGVAVPVWYMVPISFTLK